jgi:hypothetical protein
MTGQISNALLNLGRIAGTNGHMRTIGGQGLCNGLANAFGAARDQSCAAFES